MRIRYRNDFLEMIKKAKKDGKCVPCEKRKYYLKQRGASLQPGQHPGKVISVDGQFSNEASRL